MMVEKTRTWKRQRIIVEKGDILVTDGKSSDVVIVVIGPSGSGKSTFINTLFNQEVTTVGHNLSSCTSKIEPIICPHPFEPWRRLVVVDTPGFDDTSMDDAEVLRRISVWLATSYTKYMKVAGVIFLHDITLNRVLGKTRIIVTVIEKICGKAALSSLVIGTTMWSGVPEDEGNVRMQCLEDTIWRDMIAAGATTFKFMNTHTSSWDVVNFVLRMQLKYPQWVDVLKLQEELVDQNKIIPNTDAGKFLRHSLLDHLEMIKKGKLNDEQREKTVNAIHNLKLPITLRLKTALSLDLLAQRWDDFASSLKFWSTSATPNVLLNSQTIPIATRSHLCTRNLSLQDRAAGPSTASVNDIQPSTKAEGRKALNINRESVQNIVETSVSGGKSPNEPTLSLEKMHSPASGDVFPNANGFRVVGGTFLNGSLNPGNFPMTVNSTVNYFGHQFSQQTGEVEIAPEMALAECTGHCTLQGPPVKLKDAPN